MRQHTRALAVLLMTLALATGCARAARDQRVSEAPPAPPPPVPAPGVLIPPPTGMSQTLLDGKAPIPGHPPVNTSGIVASFDPTTGILTFQDGRMLKLTDQSKVLQPVDTRAVRPGEQVIVRNALPVGVRSASSTSGSGKRQRMATVAGIDEPNGVVRLMDGTAIRVTPATKMHMGRRVRRWCWPTCAPATRWSSSSQTTARRRRRRARGQERHRPQGRAQRQPRARCPARPRRCHRATPTS